MGYLHMLAYFSSCVLYFENKGKIDNLFEIIRTRLYVYYLCKNFLREFSLSSILCRYNIETIKNKKCLLFIYRFLLSESTKINSLISINNFTYSELDQVLRIFLEPCNISNKKTKRIPSNSVPSIFSPVPIRTSLLSFSSTTELNSFGETNVP